MAVLLLKHPKKLTLIERSLEVKLPSIWADEKQRWEESEREEKKKDQERESQEKEDPGARKGRKVAKHGNFPMIVAPEGRKVGSLKRRVQASWPDERWKIARRCGAKHVSNQNVQNTTCSDHFWKLRCRKSARRCGAKHISKSKVQNLRGTEHFWTFRCRFAWQAQGSCTLLKVGKKWRFCSSWITTTTTLHTTPVHSTLHYNNYYNYNYNYTTYTTLR